MFKLWVAALALVAALLGDAGHAVRAAETTAVASTLEKLYRTAYDEALNRHAVLQRDGTTYVSSGDIDAEWLRDAAATLEPYISLAGSDQHVRQVLHGTVARMARYILLDPYANAFWANYRVAERKFEVDSLLYPVWFASRYWKGTRDRSIFTPQVNRAFERALEVLHNEQHHASRSHYRHPDLADGGEGAPVRFTGMVWTGFRPSDDPSRYGFNVPENMFAVVVLRDLAKIEKDVYHNERDAENAWGLSVEIERGIEQHGRANVKGIGRMYAYEVDGLGHAALMDDANVPSLLSIPYFGYLSSNDPAYRSTREFILSTRNKYFYVGRYASGIGSSHTPRGYVWPLALVMQALTSRNQAETDRVMDYIAAADVGDHRLHESFNANWPESFTREDFAWPNALYAKLVQLRGTE